MSEYPNPSEDTPSESELVEFLEGLEYYDPKQKEYLKKWITESEETKKIVIESYRFKNNEPSHCRMGMEYLRTQIEEIMELEDK
jgi:hypothetical protein